MASEIKVDTISEKTSAGGVTIDGLLIKDGGISGDVSLIGTTPTFTIGDAGAEDAALVFDGNAKDFYVALDDSADKLVIGEGSTVGTNSILTITDDSVTVGDAAAVDTKIVFDGNAQDYYVGLDDSSDSLVLGLGSALGTTPAITINSSQVATFAQAPVFPDGSIAIDDLNIDGGTDIGAALVDADEIIVDDGGGGTNRRCDMSRVKTYAKTAFPGIDDTSSSFDDCVTITDNEVVINEDGDNQDFRVESDDLSNFFFCDASANKAGFSKHDRSDMGFIHITTASSGASSPDAGADELILEGSGHCGMTIFSGTTSSASLYLGDSGGSYQGYVEYSNNTDTLILGATATNAFQAKGLVLSSGGETAADAGAGGITLDQNAIDTPIMTFKSSDIAHGMTDNFETDTYCKIGKETDVYGGVDITGISESEVGFRARGFITTATTAKNTSSKSGVELRTMLKSGSGLVNMSSDGNLVSIYNNATARFIFDAEGSFHADVESTTFDKYDDAQLVRAFDLSHGKGTIDSKFDKFIAYNHEKLAELKLVGREEDGTPNHFVNVTGMQRLHNGAIWQQYEKHERLLEAVYDLAKEAVGEDKANAILDKHEVKRLQ